MRKFIEYLENKIEGCKATKAPYRDKIIYQLVLDEYKNQLLLHGFVPMSLCIDNTGTSYLTKGKKYAVLFEGTEMYTIINDIGERDIYAIDRFELLTPIKNN